MLVQKNIVSETAKEIPAGVELTVHLKGGYTTDVVLTISLGTLGAAV